jgi:hypothetical protein
MMKKPAPFIQRVLLDRGTRQGIGSGRKEGYYDGNVQPDE